jgi:hypothetical protein
LRGAQALRALIVLGGVAARPGITSSEHTASLMERNTRCGDQPGEYGARAIMPRFMVARTTGTA